MLYLDRMKRAFFALFKAAVPRLDYYALYSAKVVVQPSSPPNVLDLQPDDPRIPSMGGIPIRHGLPGVKIQVGSGSSVLIGWENGDPSRPFCALWEGGETAAQITIVATQIFLGDKSVADGGSLIPVLDGVVTGQGVDPFTGLPYFALGNTSAVVSVKKQ